MDNIHTGNKLFSISRGLKSNIHTVPMEEAGVKIEGDFVKHGEKRGGRDH